MFSRVSVEYPLHSLFSIKFLNFSHSNIIFINNLCCSDKRKTLDTNCHIWAPQSAVFLHSALHIVWGHVLNAASAPLWPNWDHYFLTDTVHIHEYVTVPDARAVKAVWASHTYVVLTTFSLDSSYMKGLRRKSYKETVGSIVGQNGANEESFLSWHHILF